MSLRSILTHVSEELLQDAYKGAPRAAGVGGRAWERHHRTPDLANSRAVQIETDMERRLGRDPSLATTT